jgi:glycosyltransferase involved in cell wall biosynthesis
MRIAVVNLTSGGLSGGYRKYLSRLMPLLANDPRVTALSVFVPEGAASAVAAMNSGIDVRAWPRQHARGFRILVRDVVARAPDVVFIPTARHAEFGNIPVVVMVRNMEPLTVPFGGTTWAEGLKNVARAWEARRACRQAARVIAVSDHVRDFIVSRWQIDRDRVGTVYHGVDDPGPAAVTPAHVSRTLFTAGSIRPARGAEDIIRALPLVDADVRLVIAGQVDAGCAGYAEQLRRLCDDLGVTSRVTFAGQLGSEDMAEAFRRCAAFVMTSRAEACPNTALEAMSYGCAIVSVDRAPMPEFLGEAALYYPIAEVRALAEHLRAILTNTAEHDRLARAARRRAAPFRWEATRDRTIKELERARS